MNGVLLFSRKCALHHFSIFNNTVITIFTNFMQYELVTTVHTDPLLIAKKVRKQITLKELFQGNFFCNVLFRGMKNHHKNLATTYFCELNFLKLFSWDIFLEANNLRHVKKNNFCGWSDFLCNSWHISYQWHQN